MLAVKQASILLLFSLISYFSTFAQDENIIIHLDNQKIHIGFAGQTTAKAIFPAVVGHSKTSGGMMGMGSKTTYVGNDAISKQSTLTLNYPIQNGKITNWKDLEKVLHHALYNELEVTPEDHSIMITETANWSKDDREKITQLAFETFNVKSFYLIKDSKGYVSKFCIEIKP
ncbi:MAG: hypothetical protein GY810_30350 [Aureispira sp.]|nr:hypothetical protein [Aureispira sp.]